LDDVSVLPDEPRLQREEERPRKQQQQRCRRAARQQECDASQSDHETDDQCSRVIAPSQVQGHRRAVARGDLHAGTKPGPDVAYRKSNRATPDERSEVRRRRGKQRHPPAPSSGAAQDGCCRGGDENNARFDAEFGEGKGRCDRRDDGEDDWRFPADRQPCPQPVHDEQMQFDRISEPRSHPVQKTGSAEGDGGGTKQEQNGREGDRHEHAEQCREQYVFADVDWIEEKSQRAIREIDVAPEPVRRYRNPVDRIDPAWIEARPGGMETTRKGDERRVQDREDRHRYPDRAGERRRRRRSRELGARHRP